MRGVDYVAQCVLDALIEDACVICGGPGGDRCDRDELGSRLTEPVVVRHYGVLRIVNHPVCGRCAAGFTRARRHGLLGTCRGAAVVTASGDCFGAEEAGPGSEAAIPVLAPFMTGDPVLALVHRVKFAGYRQLGAVLAGTVAAYVRGSEPVDSTWSVTAVPMTAADRRRRGYSLPETIAARIAVEAQMSLIDNGLRKIRATRRQSQTPDSERGDNVRGAFEALGPLVRDKRVLVVDDLVTSGATAADCCAAILAGGAAGVAVACIGRAL